jgi:hypothetical protein
MNNVLAELLNLKKYTKTKEEDALLNLKIKKTKVMQQTILQLGIFKKLGTLQSSTAPSSIFFCPAIVLTCPVKSLYLSGLLLT